MTSKWHANQIQAGVRPLGAVSRPKASIKVIKTPLLVHGWPKPGAFASEMHRDRATGACLITQKTTVVALLIDTTPQKQNLKREMEGYISLQPVHPPYAVTLLAAGQMPSGGQAIERIAYVSENNRKVAVHLAASICAAAASICWARSSGSWLFRATP